MTAFKKYWYQKWSIFRPTPIHVSKHKRIKIRWTLPLTALPEVVSPLRYTVGLIHCYRSHLQKHKYNTQWKLHTNLQDKNCTHLCQFPQPSSQLFCLVHNELWRDIEDIDLAVLQRLEHLARLPLSRPQEGGTDAGRVETQHLAATSSQFLFFHKQHPGGLVVQPDLDLPGSENICLSGSGSENNIGSGSKLIVKIILCPSSELTLHSKLFIPLFNCPISFLSIHYVKNEFQE